MVFDKIIEIEKVNEYIGKVNFREAVRAVIIKNNKILMVNSKNKDYKFPGGGVKKYEEKLDALKREVEEETGYVCSDVKDIIGIVTEKSKDRFHHNKLFKMISYYYIVEVSDVQKEQKLDDYEKELEFKPVWINIEEAILQNKLIIEDNISNIPNWIYRETYVLKEIENAINKNILNF